MVYKSLHVLAPQYLCNLFTRASQLASRCLRNTLTDLRLPKKSSKTGQKCFSFRGAKAWNDLSAEGKLTSSLACFETLPLIHSKENDLSRDTMTRGGISDGSLST